MTFIKFKKYIRKDFKATAKSKVQQSIGVIAMNDVL